MGLGEFPKNKNNEETALISDGISSTTTSENVIIGDIAGKSVDEIEPIDNIEKCSSEKDILEEIDDTDRSNNDGIYPVEYEELFPRMAQYEDFLILLKKLLF